jgi:hypothetical protein
MSFLKSILRRVKRTVKAVATVAIGGALSAAVGAAIRPLGSVLVRGAGSFLGGLKSSFLRGVIQTRRAGLDPFANFRGSALSRSVISRAKSESLNIRDPFGG